jgi:hypothetical protein
MDKYILCVLLFGALGGAISVLCVLLIPVHNQIIAEVMGGAWAILGSCIGAFIFSRR